MPPHNLPLTRDRRGAALVRLVRLQRRQRARRQRRSPSSAFVATNTATAAATLSWMLAEWLSRGKPTVLGAAAGAVAGLVAITPASGFVTPMASIVIGGVAGVLCYAACNLKSLLGYYDDALDVVGVHGVGGTWGALATGLFATKVVNSAIGQRRAAGLRERVAARRAGAGDGRSPTGSPSWERWSVSASPGLVTGGIRVDEDEEFTGLDLSQHSETRVRAGSRRTVVRVDDGNRGASTLRIIHGDRRGHERVYNQRFVRVRGNPRSGTRAGGKDHEKSRSDHQAVQARRGEGKPLGASACRASPSARSRDSAGRRATPSSIAAPSTSSTSCPR